MLNTVQEFCVRGCEPTYHQYTNCHHPQNYLLFLCSWLHTYHSKAICFLHYRCPVSRISCTWSRTVRVYLSCVLLLGTFVLAVAQITSSFLVVADMYSLVQIYHNLFIHSCADEHLDCFQMFGAIMHKVAMNIYTSPFVALFSLK